MAIKNIIAKGIGFSPGSIKFIVTHGFISGTAFVVGIIQPPLEPYPYAPIIGPNGIISPEWERWFQRVIDSEYSMLTEQAGPPGSTPARIGLTNVDTTNKDIYVSAGTSSSADWIKVNN